MNDEIRKELQRLKLKLHCGRILFTIVAILLSVVLSPVGIVLSLVMLGLGFAVATLGVFVYFLTLPVIVGYECIKTNLGDGEDENNKN